MLQLLEPRGFIKNAILTALSIACASAEQSRAGTSPGDVHVTQETFAGCWQLQLRLVCEGLFGFENSGLGVLQVQLLASQTRGLKASGWYWESALVQVVGCSGMMYIDVYLNLTHLAP